MLLGGANSEVLKCQCWTDTGQMYDLGTGTRLKILLRIMRIQKVMRRAVYRNRREERHYVSHQEKSQAWKADYRIIR